jgi:hypothetical protein
MSGFSEESEYKGCRANDISQYRFFGEFSQQTDAFGTSSNIQRATFLLSDKVVNIES